jgi:lysozyme family protein
MKDNFQKALKLTLGFEGGYGNHPSDPGGMTNHGVTKRTWEDWTGESADEQCMRELSVSDVVPLYRERFWNKVRGDELPSGLDYCVFDCAVNSGPKQAIVFLQRILGVDDDGVIGPITLAAVKREKASDLIDDYSDLRLRFLEKLKTYAVFGKGWTRRVNAVEDYAKKNI